MRKTIGIFTLIGLSNSAGAHTSTNSVSFHMIEHALPVAFSVMLLAIAFKMFSKR